MSESESDPELELHEEPNLMATRKRRANAGSRLKALLTAEEPLDDEDNIFMEFDDDMDFEEGQDLEPLDIGSEDEEEEEDEEEQEETDQKRPKKRKASEVEEEDDFFSSESESDENEGDDQDEEAGEKELQKQQRAEKRKQQQERKKKMFEIKSLTQPLKKKKENDNNQQKPAPARQRTTAADLLSGSRRVSKRSAVVKNTKAVIERLKESEAKRASVPQHRHKKKQVRKMTQEERLEEAKITEKKNIASLNRYVELEEARRQRQRAAVLARRKPLTNVIRYVSSTKLVPPRRIFTRPKIEVVSSVKESKDVGAKTGLGKEDGNQMGDGDKKSSSLEEGKSLDAPVEVKKSKESEAIENEKEEDDQGEKKELDVIEKERKELVEGEHQKELDVEGENITEQSEKVTDTAVASNSLESGGESQERQSEKIEELQTERQVVESESPRLPGESTGLAMELDSPEPKEADVAETEQTQNGSAGVDSFKVSESGLDSEVSEKEETERSKSAEVDVQEGAGELKETPGDREGSEEARDRDPGESQEPVGLQEVSETPEEKNQDPGNVSLEPEDKSQEPEDKSLEPEEKSQEPEKKSEGPEGKSQEPEEMSREPEEKSQEPEESQEPEKPKTHGHFPASMVELPEDFAPAGGHKKRRLSKSSRFHASEYGADGQYRLPDVVGPYSIRQRNTVTLVNFDDELDYTRIRVRGILFGKQAALIPAEDSVSSTGGDSSTGKTNSGGASSGSVAGISIGSGLRNSTANGTKKKISSALSSGSAAAVAAATGGNANLITNAKSYTYDPREVYRQVQMRTCTVTGKIAKFTDPETGIKYATMDAFSMVQLVKGGHLKWNSALGGVYKTAEGEKHASGVPPGFV